MKAHDLAFIVIKSLGIYWLVEAILHLIHGVLMPFTFLNLKNISEMNWTVELINWLLIGVLYASTSYLLIFRTREVMRFIKLDKTLSESPSSTNKSINYEELAFTLVGLYFAIPAIGRIAPQIVRLWLLRKSVPGLYGSMYQESYLAQVWPSLIENTVVLLVGIILIAGRNSLTRLWRRLRPLAARNK